MPDYLLLTSGDRLLLAAGGGDALLLAVSMVPAPVPASALGCVVTPFCPEEEEA